MRGKVLAFVLAGLIGSGGAGIYAGETAPKPPAEAAAPAKTAKPNPIGQYFVNRFKDFADIFNIKLALGDSSSVLVNVRATRLVQVGAGRFAGTKIGFDGPCAGVYGEGRVEYGLSVFYWSWIGRKVNKAGITAEAEKRNWFFGDVDNIKAGESYREYYDGNRAWSTIGASFNLPFLPGIEAYVHPAEAVDFVLSIIPIPGLRIPPPFYKTDANGDKVPAPESIRWHGQEQFEIYD